MMIRFTAFSALASLALLFGACGGSDPGAEVNATASPIRAASATAATSPPGAAPEATSVAIDPSRFVFGAIPGKHAVYWIHTDW